MHPTADASPSDSFEPGKSKSDPPARKPRRILRWIGFGLLGVFVLLAGAAYYLQTAHAFNRVIFPIIQKRVPGTFSVESGTISFGGQLNLQRVAYADEDSRVDVKGSDIKVRVAPLSFIFGSQPRIESIEISDAEVVLNQDPVAGELKDKMEAEPTPTPVPEKDKDGRPLIPIAIDSVDAARIRVAVIAKGKTEYDVKLAELKLRDLAPGGKGTLKLATDYSIAPEDPARAMAGAVQSDLNFALDAAGRAIDWNGTVGLTAKDQRKESPLPEMKFDATTKGLFDPGKTIEQTAKIAATEAGKPAGDIGLALQWRAKDDAAEIDSTLDFKSIGREFLNPFLAISGPARLESGILEGSVVVKSAGEQTEYNASLSGKNLSLRPAPADAPTPAAEFASTQQGFWNQKTEVLTIEKAHLDLKEGGRTLVSTSLTEAMRIRTKSEDAAAAPAAGPASALPPQEAKLELKIDRVTADEIRPWLVAFGVEGMEDLQTGVIDGDLAVNLVGEGQSVKVAGRLDATDLRMKQADDSVLGPVALETRLDASLADMKQLALAPSGTRLLMDGELLASLSNAGSLDLETGAIALDHTIEAADISKLLSRLALITPEQTAKIRGGALKGSAKLARADKDSATSVQSDINLASLTLVSTGDRTIEQSVALTSAVETDAKGAGIDIKNLLLEITRPGGATGGTAEVKGYWPLDAKAEGAKPGKLALTIRKLDGAPWLDFAGVLANRQVAEAPIEADLAIEADAAMERIKIAGEERIGPIRMTAADGSAKEVTLKIQNEIEKIGENLKKVLVDLDSTRPGAPADDVRVELSGTLGERPDLKVTANIAELDAGFYADLLREPPPPPVEKPIEEIPEGAEIPEESVPARPVRIIEEFPIDLDANITVGKLVFRETRVESTKLALKGRDGGLSAQIDETRILEGRFAGGFDFQPTAAGQKISWRLTGGEIDMGKIMDSVQPGRARQVEGLLKLESSGAGEGPADDLMNRLQGKLTFELVNGRIGRSRLLHYIAQKTKVDFFDQMLFSKFDGNIEIAEGKATLAPVNVQGKAQLIGEGTVGFDRRLDIWVTPRVGPELAGLVKGPKLVEGLLSTVDGLTEFPFSIRVRGTTDAPKFGVGPRVPTGLKKGAEFVGGTVGGVAKLGGDAVKTGVGGVLKAGEAVMQEGVVGGVVKGGEAAVGGAVKGGAAVVGGTVKAGEAVAGGAVKGGEAVVGGAVKGGEAVVEGAAKTGGAVVGGAAKGAEAVGKGAVKGAEAAKDAVKGVLKNPLKRDKEK